MGHLYGKLWYETLTLRDAAHTNLAAALQDKGCTPDAFAGHPAGFTLNDSDPDVYEPDHDPYPSMEFAFAGSTGSCEAIMEDPAVQVDVSDPAWCGGWSGGGSNR